MPAPASVNSPPRIPHGNNGKIRLLLDQETLFVRAAGGGTGIRTLGTLARTTVFETAPFNHSGIPPRRPVGRQGADGLQGVANMSRGGGPCSDRAPGQGAGSERPRSGRRRSRGGCAAEPDAADADDRWCQSSGPAGRRPGVGSTRLARAKRGRSTGAAQSATPCRFAAVGPARTAHRTRRVTNQGP